MIGIFFYFIRCDFFLPLDENIKLHWKICVRFCASRTTRGGRERDGKKFLGNHSERKLHNEKVFELKKISFAALFSFLHRHSILMLCRRSRMSTTASSKSSSSSAYKSIKIRSFKRRLIAASFPSFIPSSSSCMFILYSTAQQKDVDEHMLLVGIGCRQ